MKKLLFAFTAAAVILITGCKENGKTTGNTDAVEIKFNLQKGDKYSYDMGVNMTMDIMGQNVKNDMSMGYIFEVTGDSSGYKVVKSSFDKIKMSSMGMNFDAESKDTTGPLGIVNKMLAGMKGSEFMFTINEHGKIGSVSGMEAMMEKMMSSFGPEAQTVAKEVGKGFTDEQFKQTIEQSFNMYPGKPIKKGDTWSGVMNTNQNGMQMKTDNTYTLEEVSGDEAKVKVVSKISSEDESKATINGTSEGIMVYDLKTGMPKTGDMKGKMDMKIKQGGQEMPAKMDMNVTVSSKKM